MSGTCLTGEPLAWQLTNAQREALGLAPVQPHWTLQEAPCGVLSDVETYMYLDGLRVMRVISCGSYGADYYKECSVAAALTADGRIVPAEGGKSVPLTAANLHKQRHNGVSLVFDATHAATSIRLRDHDARRTLLDLHLPQKMSLGDFDAWLEEHCLEEIRPSN